MIINRPRQSRALCSFSTNNLHGAINDASEQRNPFQSVDHPDRTISGVSPLPGVLGPYYEEIIMSDSKTAPNIVASRDRIAETVNEFCAAIGFGRTFFYKEVHRGSNQNPEGRSENAYTHRRA